MSEESTKGISRRTLLASAGVSAATAALAGAAAETAAASQNRGFRKGVARTKEYLAPRVLVLNYEPIIEAEGGKRLREIVNWNDPRYLCDAYIADILACSGGYVRYNVVDWKDLDEHPVKKDGFRYTDESFLEMWRSRPRKHHEPDAIDYHAIIDAHDVVRRIDSGDIDEVWLMSYPFTGTWESTMGGPTPYFVNSPPLEGVKSKRNFVIMGFNYERGVGEMLEDLGHRTESIMRHVYGSWNGANVQHNWDRFTLHDKEAPGRSACGNIHYAPNSDKDYDWGNKRYVVSTCDDWLNYPNLKGEKRVVNTSDWGNGYIRSHHRWWFERLPKAPGRNPDGKLNNWWDYVIDPNSHPESDGSKQPAGGRRRR